MHRSTLEILLAILKCIHRHQPIKTTHIMYKANLNGQTLHKHLDWLLSHDLITKHHVGKGRYVYKCTQKGAKVILYFNRLERLLMPNPYTNRPTQTLLQNKRNKLNEIVPIIRQV